MITVVFGLPGSGKSYFAERLAKKLSGVYLSTDRVRKDEFSEKNYSLSVKKMVYQRMITLGKEALQNGRSVVFDGTFYLESLRALVYENFPDYPYIYFIEVVASEALIEKRTQKKRMYSDADFEIHKKIMKAFQPMKAPHLQLVSTDDNLEKMVTRAIGYYKLNEKS